MAKDRFFFSKFRYGLNLLGTGKPVPTKTIYYVRSVMPAYSLAPLQALARVSERVGHAARAQHHTVRCCRVQLATVPESRGYGQGCIRWARDNTAPLCFRPSRVRSQLLPRSSWLHGRAYPSPRSDTAARCIRRLRLASYTHGLWAAADPRSSDTFGAMVAQV
jgi:hypothetical protein